MTRAVKFGPLLRRARIESKRTLAEVASTIGVSVPFLSDVECERRSPLSGERINIVAKFLQADAAELHAAAQNSPSRDSYDLPCRQDPLRRDVGALLAATWIELSRDQLLELKKWIERQRGTNGQ